MVRGMYTAASGMLVQQHRIDMIANNLANVNTSGFRADRMITRAFPSMFLYRVNDAGAGSNGLPAPIGLLGTGAFVDGTVRSLEEGELRFTARALDVAIVGEGFFLVQTPGGLRLTRDGGFHISADGWLVTADGHMVVGQEGPIRVSEGEVPPAPVVIDGSGGVWVGDERVGTLVVVNVDNPELLGKEGGNRFVPNEATGEPQPLAAFRLAPEHKEGSNVQVVSEMVRMISAYRAYEAAQRAVHAHDQMLEKAVNEVGRL